MLGTSKVDVRARSRSCVCRYTTTELGTGIRVRPQGTNATFQGLLRDENGQLTTDRRMLAGTPDSTRIRIEL